MNCEEELRKIVDATYEDGRMIVARIDVCNIATKQLLNLIDKSKQEGIRTGNRELLDTVEAMFPELKQSYWQSKRWQAFLKEQGGEK